MSKTVSKNILTVIKTRIYLTHSSPPVYVGKAASVSEGEIIIQWI